MITMREQFVQTTSALLDTVDNLSVVLADIGYALFKDSGAAGQHPERVINVGIREQAMISFAAGMALEGFRPIVHTYAPFLVQRPFEQIKLDFSHQGVGAILVSVGASYDASAAGRTHQAPGDVALMKTLPNWRIWVPGHAGEVDRIMGIEAVSADGAYIRLADDSNVNSSVEATEGLSIIQDGGTTAPMVIAVGPMLDRVIQAVSGIDITIAYVNRVEPFPSEELRAALKKPEIIVVEPFQEGTLSADIAEAVRDIPHRQLCIGVPKLEFRKYGEPEDHGAAFGLDPDGIRKRIAEFLSI